MEDLRNKLKSMVSSPGHAFLSDCDEDEIDIIIDAVIDRYNKLTDNGTKTEKEVPGVNKDTFLEVLIAECHYGYRIKI